MRSGNIVVLLTLLATSLVLTNCRKKGSGSDSSTQETDSVTIEALQSVTNNEIFLQAPESCDDAENSDLCETWLGIRSDGKVGLTHILNRVSFSIEDLESDGSFQIAVYPDCKLDERVDTEQPAGESVSETPESDEQSFIKEGSDGTEVPPLLSDSETVTPPEDNDPSIDPAQPLSESPLSGCRKLVTPPTALGDPVEMIDPNTADQNSLWTIHFPAEGHPVFVSKKTCDETPDCRIRLLLGDDGYLTAINVTEGELGLKSFWKKLRGKVSKGFSAVETGVANAKKLVGTNVNIDKLGGKKLYVTASLPATKIYSAVREQGPEALSLADGTIHDGAVYAKVGGKYVESGGVAAMEGAKYIAEYVMNNACYLSMASYMAYTFGDLAVLYEAALSSHFLEYYNKYAGKMSYKSMVEDKASPTYYQVRAIALQYASYATIVSGKFKVEEFYNLIMDVIYAAFAGNIKAGYTPILVSKLATAICKGTDQALSSAHAVMSTPNTNGLSDDCLEGIKSRANSRYESAAEDLCYALKDEISAAATHVPADNKITNSWKDSVKNCPTDQNADGYQTLLEGIGCQKKRLIVDQNDNVGDLPIDDSTILTHQRYWARTKDWHATLKCPAGSVAVGACTSGGDPDCFGTPKELLCAHKDGESIVNNSKYVDIYKNAREDIAYCRSGYAVTEFCSSGGNRDCSGWSEVVRCSQISSKYVIDYSNCDSKEAKSWYDRLEATAPNHVMVGLCASGKGADCGTDFAQTKAAVFCPLKPVAEDDGLINVFEFYSDKVNDHMLTTDIGANPYSYVYQGTGFKVYPNDGTDRVPLNRCLAGSNDHFASTTSNCEGQKFEGRIGFMSSKSGKPIYRCYGNGDHLITADKTQCDKGGFKLEGILGYAP